MKKQSNKKSDIPQSSLSETAATNSALRERIAQKAYELYEKRGWGHGLDTEDWLEAERLVLAETTAETKAETVAKVKTPLRERTIAPKSGSILGRQGSL
ncbi:MAG: DUF2934 domain-containing protein [Nitrospirae bacterium]|nr:DUF2934 domain-containing protein [Nitrospirota bacterium]